MISRFAATNHLTKHRSIAASVMTTVMCCSSIAFAQTPTPTSTLRLGEVPKWVSDYRVPLPKEGLVPDKETAVKVAEVILFRLYGEERHHRGATLQGKAGGRYLVDIWNPKGERVRLRF